VEGSPPSAPPSAERKRRGLGEVIAGWSRATKAVAEGLAAIIAVLAAFGVIKATSGDERKQTPTPTATPSGEVRIDPSAIRVRATPPSLRRQDDDRTANDYIADNVLDGSVRTAWAEGAPGLGVGARLRFTLPERAELTRIRIVNGYGKSRAHLLDNAAAKSIVIDTGGDRRPLRRRLSRTARPQSVRAKFGTTRQVTITITSAYRGDRFEDLAISEVSFYAKRA
jgi:hypothetical protein